MMKHLIYLACTFPLALNLLNYLILNYDKTVFAEFLFFVAFYQGDSHNALTLCDFQIFFLSILAFVVTLVAGRDFFCLCVFQVLLFL